MTILIYGKHEVRTWSSVKGKPVVHSLEEEGDYVFIKKGTYHDWKTLKEENLILRVCW